MGQAGTGRWLSIGSAQAGAEAARHRVPGMCPSLELAFPLGISTTDLDEGAAQALCSSQPYGQ